MSSLFFFEQDLDGTNPSNVVTGELASVTSLDNTNRIIVPLSGPFFAKDLKLEHTNAELPLVLGLDYELGGQYLELDGLSAHSLYSHIKVINPKLLGSIKLTYRTIGGQYVLPHPHVLSYLVGRLNSDRTVKWSQVKDRLPMFAPKKHMFDWHDNLNTAPVADAIRRLIPNAVSRVEGGVDFTPLCNELSAMIDTINDSGFESHIRRVGNVHGNTPASIDALAADAAAVDAMHLHGKSMLELVKYIKDQGINQEVLNEYLSTDGANPLLANLLVSKAGTMLVNGDSTTVVSNEHGTLNFFCEGSSNITAGMATDVEFRAGVHKLKLHGGIGIDHDALKLNTFTVITTKNLRDYVGTITRGRSDERSNLQFGDTSTVTTDGVGTVESPLTMSAVISNATDVVRGITKLYDRIGYGTATDGVIGSNVIYSLANAAGLKVKNTVTIGGKPLTDNLTLTSKDFTAMDQVDNTEPLLKPVPKSLTAALAGKVDIDHTHGDVVGIVEDATSTILGIAKLCNTDDRTETEAVVVTPKALKRSADVVEEVYETAINLLPAGLGINSYGSDDYLPPQIDGDYGSAGVSSVAMPCCVVVEGSGRAVFLRNGSDDTNAGVFYFHASVDKDNVVHNETSLSKRYTAAWLGDRIPKCILAAGHGLFILETTDGVRHVVLTNGTMDGDLHYARTLTDSITIDHGTQLFMSNTVIYIAQINYANEGLSVSMHTSDRSVWDGTYGSSYFRARQISGTSLNGVTHTNVTTLNLMSGIAVAGSAGANNAIALRTDDNFWRSCNIKHSHCDMLVHSDNARMVGIIAPAMYFASTSTEMWGAMAVRFTFDFQTNVFTVLNMSEGFPIRISRTAVESSFRISNPDLHSIPTSRSNGPTCSAYLGNKQWACIHYNRNEATPSLTVWSNEEDPIEAIITPDRINNKINRTYIEGNRGSPIGFNTRGLMSVEGNYLVGFSANPKVGGDTYWRAKFNDIQDAVNGYWHMQLTSDRVEITEEEYLNHKRIPTTSTTGQALRSNGFVIVEPGTQPTRFSNGEFSDPITITEERFNEIRSWGINILRGTEPAIPNSDAVTMTMYRFEHGDTVDFAEFVFKTGDGDAARFRIMVLKVIWQTQLTADGTVISGHSHVNSLQVNRTDTVVPTRNPATVASLKHTSGSYAKQFTRRAGASTPTAYAYGMCAAPTCPYVGNSMIPQVLLYDESHRYLHQHTYGPHASTLIGRIGVVTQYPHSSGEAVTGKVYGGDDYTDYVSWNSIYDTNICTSRMPEGFNLYVTSEVNACLLGVNKRLPKASFNLAEISPDEYMNTHFTLSVVFNDGNLAYRCQRGNPWGNDRTYTIADIYTDGNGITRIEIKSGPDIGDYAELTEHISDPHAHNLGNYTKGTIGLGQVEDMRFADTIDEAVLKEYPLEETAMSYEALITALSDQKRVLVHSGTIRHGSVIPEPLHTPIGGDYQISYFVCFDDFKLAPGSTVRKITCSLGAGRRVSIKITDMAGNDYADNLVTAKYYAIVHQH